MPSKSFANKLTASVMGALGIALFFVFFTAQLYSSSQKSLWTDEIYALTSVQSASYGQLIIEGVAGQGSPSPLDYIFVKSFDQLKASVSAFGLSDLSYYRLWPNVCTTLAAGLIYFLLLLHIARSDTEIEIKMVQYILSIFVPLKFLLTTDVYYYAMEMRPYALWNSLWFVALGLWALNRRSKLFMVTLILLSLSATAAVFQLAALVFSFWIIGFMQKESGADLLDRSWRIFLIPIIIAVYYSMRAPSFGYGQEQWGTWEEFIRFWLGQAENLYLLLLIGMGCLAIASLRTQSFVPLAMLLLFLLAPLIFYLTRAKGFFFTPRQYIYYSTAKPLATLLLIQLLPSLMALVNPKKMKYAILIGVLALGLANNVSSKLFRKTGEVFGYSQQLFKQE